MQLLLVRMPKLSSVFLAPGRSSPKTGTFLKNFVPAFSSVNSKVTPGPAVGGTRGALGM